MITIKEIAERAGVTPTTVSNVLHGRHNKVSPQTVERIQELLKETNYVPRFGLSALTNRGSRMIGVIISTPEFFEHSPYERPFYGSVIGFLESYFRMRGYYIMIFSSKDIQKILEMLLGWNVDGVIAISMPRKYYQRIGEMTKKPVVSIDMDVSEAYMAEDYYNVTSKDYEGGMMMMRCLLDHGIEKFTYFSNTWRGADYRRYQGAETAYKERFGKKAELSHVLLNGTMEERCSQYASVIDQKGPKSGLLFSTDFNAVEAIAYYTEQGLNIPEDFSIVGADDDIFARLSAPKLTTLRVDSRKKAESAADMLIDLIEQKSVRKKNLEIDVEMIERASVIKK